MALRQTFTRSLCRQMKLFRDRKGLHSPEFSLSRLNLKRGVSRVLDVLKQGRERLAGSNPQRGIVSLKSGQEMTFRWSCRVTLYS